MKITANRADALQFLIEGTVALTDVQANGIHIDVEYCERMMRTMKKRIIALKEDLESTDEVKTWKKIYRTKFNIDANAQLARVLFEEMGHEPVRVTKTGKPSVDEETLATLDIPFVKRLLELRKLQKARNTYFANIVRETVDGVLRPVFNLQLVKTFRSSSDAINFQNIPVRDPKIGKLIRRAFKASPGHQLVEVDYSGAEVRVAACYHEDPVMIANIIDPERDMHRDAAAECYKLTTAEMTKAIRYCGKNKFVFPEFYGDYYASCAASLWKAIASMDLKTKAGLPLKDHLRSQGITHLKQRRDATGKPMKDPGSFEQHIRKVEKNFWEVRFKVYNAWKKKHYNAYLKRGYFDMATGFRCSGVMKRNDVINYPVQGAAFHCLLWSLIRLNDLFHDKGLKTKIVGQIHDSIVMDVKPSELASVLALCRCVMCDEVREHWDWIKIPLEIEAEVAPVDGTWYDKKEVVL